MTYNDFLIGLKVNLSGSSSDMYYVAIQLEDLIELDFNTYPKQTGKAGWVIPAPSTIDSDSTVTYGAKIIIVEQIKTDGSDRFEAISRCLTAAYTLLSAYPSVNYPTNITPVVLFDGMVDGIQMDILVTIGAPC